MSYVTFLSLLACVSCTPESLRSGNGADAADYPALAATWWPAREPVAAVTRGHTCAAWRGAFESCAEGAQMTHATMRVGAVAGIGAALVLAVAACSSAASSGPAKR